MQNCEFDCVKFWSSVHESVQNYEFVLKFGHWCMSRCRIVNLIVLNFGHWRLSNAGSLICVNILVTVQNRQFDCVKVWSLVHEQ